MIYADENDVNLFLYNRYGLRTSTDFITGSDEWIGFELSNKFIETGLSFLAAATNITVADGTKYKAGMIVNNSNEFLLITAIVGNILTVIRGLKGSTPADGTSLTALTSWEKIQLCEISTAEINAYHNQSQGDFLFLETELKDIASENAIELAKLKSAMDTAEFVKTLAVRDYSDGVLSIGSPGSRRLSPYIKNKLKQVLNDNGYETGIFQRR